MIEMGQLVRPPEGCNPGEGCFNCPFPDCRYGGNKISQEEEYSKEGKVERIGASIDMLPSWKGGCRGIYAIDAKIDKEPNYTQGLIVKRISKEAVEAFLRLEYGDKITPIRAALPKKHQEKKPPTRQSRRPRKKSN